jgi:multiple sugar transport system substrate-binding protein
MSEGGSMTGSACSDIALKGMSWSHPRGYDPLVAAARTWRAQTGVEIAWDRRSLQDFEDFPVEELARRYDLMIIDHPHIGEATAQGSLAPLDEPHRGDECAALRAASVGPSYASYTWAGRQWALPIDAATQVQAFRPDLIDAPPSSWREVDLLARRGLVDCPMRPPHSLMVAYTLAANLGAPCAVAGPDLFDRRAGAQAVDMIRDLAASIDASCYAKDPIDVLEAMSKPDSRIATAPLIYGYVSYAREGFRERILKFADIPPAGAAGPIGSAIGGAGIAVSAFSRHRAAASDFAFWVASGPIQRGLYAEAGGQPAHAGAWEDVRVNAAAGRFYFDTRATLEGAWMRPRQAGYLAFQHEASERLNEGVKAGEGAAKIVDALNEMFRRRNVALLVEASHDS